MTRRGLRAVLGLVCGAVCMAQAAAQVPFVGCAADGQVGPVAAPARGNAPLLSLPAEAAAKLAWYQATDVPGVLAPRTWHCFATYGSNGSTLYVAPEPISSAAVFRDGWRGFRGPAVQISSMSGSTSGRFEVAKNVARYFPAFLPFTRSVIAEGLVPASDFPRGPFPHDRIVRKGKNLVEYETPAGHEGQGTQSRLRASGDSIRGFVFVSMQPQQDAYDVTLTVRLAEAEQPLVPLIVAAGERALRSVGK